MHESQNRPTTGISDCPGCARHGHPPGRTRGHSYSRRSLAGEKPHAVGVWPSSAKGVSGHRSAFCSGSVSDGRCGSDGWEAGIKRRRFGHAFPLLEIDAARCSADTTPMGWGGGSGRVRRAWTCRPGPGIREMLERAVCLFKADPPTVGARPRPSGWSWFALVGSWLASPWRRCFWPNFQPGHSHAIRGAAEVD
jgi:hypothetical protein